MTFVLLFISIALLILYLKERSHTKQLIQGNQYINSRLKDIVQNDDSNYILLPAADPIIKESILHINHLLKHFHHKQIANHRNQKAMLEIFTNISHDLRTPITVLNGYVEMLYLQSEKEHLSPSFKKIIDKMQINSKELVHSINSFFNMAKIQSGDITLHIQRIDLTQICQETILEYFDLLEKEQIQVEVQLEDKPLYAEIDPNAMKRVLKNLIDNSIQYGLPGKYLGLAVYQRKDMIYIEVEDHGIGISEKDIQHIFTRAYTVDRKHGNGLGLSIASQLTKLMNGFISVESIPYVKTVFTIHLNR